MKECTETCERNICKIRKTVGGYLQESYAVVVCAIQPEGIFLQGVTKNMVDVFAGMEKLLRETFFTCLFFGKSKFLTPLIGNLIMMPIKKAILGFQNHVTSTNEKYLIY